MASNCYVPGVLSCEPNWSVRVCTPGGKSTIADLSMFAVTGKMERALDATSQATVEMLVETREAKQCCEALADVGGGWGCAELEIRRDDSIAWAGPITVTSWQYGRLAIVAEDLTAWWGRRQCGDINVTNVDLSVIFNLVQDWCVAEEPVTGLYPVATPTGILGSRAVLASDDKYCAEIIDELARTGLDYTAIGRDIICGGSTLSVAPIVNITDDQWVGDGPTVEWAGETYASRVIVHGGNSLRAVAEQPVLERTCGLVTRVFHEDSILDQTSLQAAADNRLSVMQNPWRILPTESDQLKCGTNVDFNQLIPGARVRVETSAACTPIIADFRLVGVSADLSKNTVGLRLAPLGTGGYVAGNDSDNGD